MERWSSGKAPVGARLGRVRVTRRQHVCVGRRRRVVHPGSDWTMGAVLRDRRPDFCTPSGNAGEV
jgi:hypothetical protein